MSTRLNSNWIVGFTDGEGCFHVQVVRKKGMKYGFQIQPVFIISQHVQDIQLLHGLKKYFGCGTVSVNQEDCYHWRVTKRNHLLEHVIPFFEKHPLKGKRRVEFQRFREICLLMGNKVHLTEEGVQLVMHKAKALRIKPSKPFVLENSE